MIHEEVVGYIGFDSIWIVSMCVCVSVCVGGVYVYCCVCLCLCVCVLVCEFVRTYFAYICILVYYG